MVLPTLLPIPFYLFLFIYLFVYLRTTLLPRASQGPAPASHLVSKHYFIGKAEDDLSCYGSSFLGYSIYRVHHMLPDLTQKYQKFSGFSVYGHKPIIMILMFNKIL